MSFGRIHALKNGVEWNGNPEISLSASTDTLIVLGTIGQADKEVIVLKIKLDGVGIYPMEAGQALYYTTVGGDALTSNYVIDGEGELEILSVSQGHQITGRFTASLRKNYDVSGNAAEQVNFTEGFFSSAYRIIE